LESISSAHSDLQNLTSATEIGTLFLDQELRIRMFTPPVAELFNITDSDVGRAITDFTHQMVYEGIERDVRCVLRDLLPMETVVESKDGQSYMMRVRPYRTIDNRIEGIVVTFVDISARLVTERQLKLMVDELNHRVKNTLSIVQAIAHQTFKQGSLEHSTRRAFEGRLSALAQAHNLLTLTHWERAALRDIATSIAVGCGAGIDRFTLDGPEVDLQPGQAVSITMALHELCTNAVKYGALSTDAGRILLQWRVLGEAEPRLRIEWRELHGPAVNAPVKRGFGSLMVEQALADGIRGTALIHFQPEGVTCIIEGPMKPVVGHS
jgi:two-component system CheB/CheR fusion protein